MEVEYDHINMHFQSLKALEVLFVHPLAQYLIWLHFRFFTHFKRYHLSYLQKLPTICLLYLPWLLLRLWYFLLLLLELLLFAS
nr:MAG TPA: hypothetical protein [Caudoviricetes sp.]